MAPPPYSIEIAPTGYDALLAIRDKRIVREIGKVIDGFADGPEKQGKALLHPFEGVRSVRAVRSRYRILYRVDAAKKTVSVLLVGERRPGREGDVYEVAQKLLKALRRGEAP